MATTAMDLAKVESKPRREHGSGRIWQVGKRWWVQFYDSSGRQHRESSRSTNKTVAERLLKRCLAEKELGLTPVKKTRAAVVTVDEAFRDELADLALRGKQTGWVKTCWNLRLKEVFGGRDAGQISLPDLEKYRSGQMDDYRGKFPNASQKKMLACESAVNKDMSVLRMILNHCKALGKILAVPTFPEKLEGAMERCGTISRVQFDAMLAACAPDELWLTALLTMAHTWGYRLRELLRMRCVQVNLDAGIVSLPPRSTKNKRARSIPILESEKELLAECMAGKEIEQHVFTRQDGKPVKDIRARWERLVTEAAAGHFEINGNNKTWHPAIFHDLRRTAITNMLAGGMPAANVRELVGHFSEEMTDRYNQPAMDTLRTARELAVGRLAELEAPRLIPESRRLSNGAKTGIVTESVEAVELASVL